MVREDALSEDISVKYPELYPDVQSEEINWYGVIYGNNGNIESILLYKKHRMANCYSGNDIVNSIYDIFI